MLRTGRWVGMNSSAWFDLGAYYGVLELHEEVTSPGPALELHVVVSEHSGVVAWWMTDLRRRCWFAEVGVA